MRRPLVEDTRQQAKKHERKHKDWEGMGVKVIRHELEVGDYTPSPRISVDTKRSMVEFAGNLRTDHARFRDECKRAQDLDCLLVVLVENDEGITSLDDLRGWRESRASFIRRRGKMPYSGDALARQCETMTERYGVQFRFCRPDEAAERVYEILEVGEEWIWRQRLGITRSD